MIACQRKTSQLNLTDVKHIVYEVTAFSPKLLIVMKLKEIF